MLCIQSYMYRVLKHYKELNDEVCEDRMITDNLDNLRSLALCSV